MERMELSIVKIMVSNMLQMLNVVTVKILLLVLVKDEIAIEMDVRIIIISKKYMKLATEYKKEALRFSLFILIFILYLICLTKIN